MTVAEKKTRKQSYADFIKSLGLYGISLVESSFKCDRDRYLKEDHRIAFNFTSRLLSDKKRAETNAFDIKTSLKLIVTGPKSGSEFLSLSADFILHIHSAVLEKEYIERLCESEARLLVWPYFREYVSSVCGRVHIPPITLPLGGGGR